jgi:hypothetical protein
MYSWAQCIVQKKYCVVGMYPVWGGLPPSKFRPLSFPAGIPDGGGGGDLPPPKFRLPSFPAGIPGGGGGGDLPPSKFRPPSQLQQLIGNPRAPSPPAVVPGGGGGGDSPPSKFRPPSQLQLLIGNPFPPGSNSPQEIPAQGRREKGGASHHPGGQLA